MHILFSVDYNTNGDSFVKDIRKYLMRKHAIKQC